MPTLSMDGPYELSPSRVDSLIKTGQPGNYAIGYCRDRDTFIVRYVGRSDSDLNRELKSRVADGRARFEWTYASSPKEAFERHCRNYHDFGESFGLDNDCHPQSPAGTGWACPVCTRPD